MNLQIPKKAAVINSFAGYGRCSLTEALPILSAMRVQACPVDSCIYPDFQPPAVSHFLLHTQIFQDRKSVV